MPQFKHSWFRSLHGKAGDQIGKVMPVLAIYRVKNVMAVICATWVFNYQQLPYITPRGKKLVSLFLSAASQPKEKEKNDSAFQQNRRKGLSKMQTSTKSSVHKGKQLERTVIQLLLLEAW